MPHLRRAGQQVLRDRLRKTAQVSVPLPFDRVDANFDRAVRGIERQTFADWELIAIPNPASCLPMGNRTPATVMHATHWIPGATPP